MSCTAVVHVSITMWGICVDKTSGRTSRVRASVSAMRIVSECISQFLLGSHCNAQGYGNSVCYQKCLAQSLLVYPPFRGDWKGDGGHEQAASADWAPQPYRRCSSYGAGPYCR